MKKLDFTSVKDSSWT